MCAVLLYGLSMIYSVFLWRRGFREDSRINYSVLLGGFAFHTVAMVARGFSFNRCPVNNLYEAITFVLWTIVVAYLGQARTTRQSRGSSQVLAFSIAASLKLGGIAAGNLFASQAWAIILVYGLPLSGLLIGGYAAIAAMAPRKATPLPGWVAGPLEALSGLGTRMLSLPWRLIGRRGRAS